MLARMLGDRRTPVPADFGVLVTAENVEAHLRQLREQVAGRKWNPRTHVKNNKGRDR